ncbi:MAG: hypothetical protein PHP51_07790 [Desulfotomaculaceae bacterium]|nr:hypothetical protein [Desulfotomaculaceae bacterium]MDD4766278.1 hypothetical protein [Desulfotomaculaceae bacterium]
MRKILLLVVFTMILSLTLSSAAIAHQHNGIIFYGNSQSGSVSFGDHGYAWYHSDSDNDSNISVIDRWRAYFNSKTDKHYKDWQFKNHFKRLGDRDGERYYYVDDNGVSHYFYLNPDREYEVRTYKDKNGTTQYSFKAIGWK